MWHWLVAFCLFSFPAGAQDVLSWYPLQVGNRWVYEWESRAGDPHTPHVARWTAIVSVKQHVRTPEGLVIVRELVFEGEANAGFVGRRLSAPYLVRNNCLYPLFESWDAQKQTFTRQFREYIEQISADLCSPLQVGRRWKGTADWPWLVEGNGPAKNGPQLGIPASAIRLVQEWTAGPLYVWFQQDVGPVAQWSRHNGTYTESLGLLRRFVPAGSAPQR